MYQMVNYQLFDWCIGVIVFANMAVVIVETDAQAIGHKVPGWVLMLNPVFLAVYSVELSAKLFAFRLSFFHEVWNVNDLLLVSVDSILLMLGSSWVNSHLYPSSGYLG